MKTDPRAEIRYLLDRLSRVAAAEERTADLTPPQFAALAYLARANRFSRAPSQVAEYLSATRGTVSQTLKALLRKGYVAETRSEVDRRSISYDVTVAGLDILRSTPLFAEPLANYRDSELAELAHKLRVLLRTVLSARDDRPFGMCRYCIHHRRRDHKLYCTLLEVPLAEEDAERICFEHVANT